MTLRVPVALRARTAAVVAIAALLVSSSMALLTFQLTRSYLTRQRDRLAASQAYLNARLLQDALPGIKPEAVPATLASLSREGGSQALLRVDGRWLGSTVGVSAEDVPDDVLGFVEDGRAARRRVNIRGQAHVAVGVPILSGEAAYFELFPLTELEQTLSTMALSLTASAVATTIGGALFGARLSRRVLRPLVVTSEVAERIAGGEIGERLPPSRDPEMAPIYASFNKMVDALEVRIQRERRFAADVSHELRTPLTALVASSAVLDNQLDQLNPRARTAAEILSSQLAHFRQLVLDLLDMARMDSGVEVADLEPVDLSELLEQLVCQRPSPRPRVHCTIDGPVVLDRRRLERVLTNLLDNAEAYAGGAVDIHAAALDGVLRIAVDDAGPGIAPDERDAIFERMHRGSAARTSGARGTGLGLALALEHLRLQGGTLRVEDAPTGGARFVVELPLHEAGP